MPTAIPGAAATTTVGLVGSMTGTQEVANPGLKRMRALQEAKKCPGGPLKMLVKESQERNEPIPGFVYDSGDGAIVESEAKADGKKRGKNKEHQDVMICQITGRN